MVGKRSFSGILDELLEVLGMLDCWLVYGTGRPRRKTSLELDSRPGRFSDCNSSVPRSIYEIDRFAIETWTKPSVNDLLMYKLGDKMICA